MTMPVDKQLHDLREAVIAMAVSLGAALPPTPWVIQALNRVDAAHVAMSRQLDANYDEATMVELLGGIQG